MTARRGGRQGGHHGVRDDAIDAGPAWAGDPAPPHAFALRLDDELALRLRERHHARELYERIDAERDHLVAGTLTWARDTNLEDAERMVVQGLGQFRRGDGWQADLCWRGRPVGSLGLHALDGPGGSTEVGYWLQQDFEGRGLVTRAMRGLHRQFFEGRGLDHVAIGAVRGNDRSEAVVRRLGYRPEAVLRHALLVDDESADLAFYGLLRSEWVADGGAGADPRPLPLPRFALRVDDELELGIPERPDADALHALIERDRERLGRWLPWAGSQTLEGTRGFIEGRALTAIAQADGFEAGVWWRGRLVGMVGIHAVRRQPRRGSIGYWLAREAEGHGLMTRAVRAVVAKGFGDLGFERLDIRADVENVRSRALPQRLGFRFEGVLRRSFFDGRRYVDQAVYGFLRDEWTS
ncbi:MAG: GNAT family N-acetyltransferase [Trueperaceae bacterium]